MLSSCGGFVSTLMVGSLTYQKHVSMTISISNDLATATGSVPFPSVRLSLCLYQCECRLQDSFGQWQIIFGILSVVYLLGAVIYLLLGTGELQRWNSPESEKEKEPESYPLRNNAP